MKSVYKMSKTDHGSDWYGPCEICGKHMDTAYIQTEYEPYTVHPTGTDDYKFIRYAHIDSNFGHKECLTSIQK